MDGVELVEIYPILGRRDGKMDLKNLHLRVLKQLWDNPRMPVVEVAERSGLTTKRVRSLISEMIDSRVFLGFNRCEIKR